MRRFQGESPQIPFHPLFLQFHDVQLGNFEIEMRVLLMVQAL